MSKEAIFTMKLEPELRAAFMEEAAGEDRPASQVLRELMRNYIESRRRTREYNSFVAQKVEAARASIHTGQGISNEELEAMFLEKRKEAGSYRK